MHAGVASVRAVFGSESDMSVSTLLSPWHICVSCEAPPFAAFLSDASIGLNVLRSLSSLAAAVTTTEGTYLHRTLLCRILVPCSTSSAIEWRQMRDQRQTLNTQGRRWILL